MPKTTDVSSTTSAVKPSTLVSIESSSSRGNPGRRRGDEQLQAAPGEKHAEDPAEHGERERFRDQLADDPSPARAKSRANGDFGPARCRAGQQQTGHVGASDQQDERDRALQDQERVAQIAVGGFLKRLEPGGVPPMPLRICAGELSGDRIDLRLRLPHRYAVFETSQRNGESQFAGDLRPCRPEGRDKIQSSPKKLKFSGRTPITVIGCWSIVRFLPITAGSLLK